MANRKKRILMLLSNPFRPDPRVHKEARSLIAAGYEVTILCWDRTGEYQEREIIDGINVTRTGPIYTGRSLGRFPLMLFRFWWRALNQARKIRPDIIHAHDLDTLPLGFHISKFHGARLVYDAHEIYAAMLGPNGQDTPLGRLIEKLERFLMRRSDKVITVNEAIARRFEERGAKTVVITNCPPLKQTLQQGASTIQSKFSLDDQFIVLYIGVLEPERFLEESIDALVTSEPDGVTLVLGGFGSLEDDLKNKSQGKKGIKIIGQVEPNLVVPYTADCDIVMCIFDPRNNLNNKMGSPNKVFDAMVAGKPVLVTKGTFAGDLVTKEKCGIAIDYTPEAFLDTIKLLKQNRDMCITLGQNGRKAAEEKYNWDIVAKVLIDVYSSL